jgi:hypothetical protein
MKSITYYAHLLIRDLVKPGQVWIDATIGNGHDTYFLCSLVKYVYGFDIQKTAIINTKEKLSGFNNYQLILDSHEHFNQYVKQFDGIIFNLGYLPNGDKSITTNDTSTINTLEKLLKLYFNLEIIIVVYLGHQEGLIESNAIINYLTTHQIRYLKLSIENTNTSSPYLIQISKKRLAK